MRTAETMSGLTSFDRRGAGTDAERRVARWLEDELGGHERGVRIEPFWCRPSWALTHAWHAALGLAGSLLAVGTPRLGGGLILLALLSVIADALLGVSLGRRLTPERASQNVVVPAPGDGESDLADHRHEGLDRGAARTESTDRSVRLILTANYDACRTGVAYRDVPRRAAARLRTLTRGLTPGWLGWLCIALVWLEAVAIARVTGSGGTVVGVAQLIPTVGLVLALALLIDVASSDFGPSAGDNGSGVSVAIALARALDAAPPRRAATELVLTGAGDVTGIGLRRYLRARRKRLTHANAVVLGLAACGAGFPRWWVSDGALIPLASFAKLRELCATLAADEPGLEALPHRGRGDAPAHPARLARLPAITIGCLDGHGLTPRSHQMADTADAIDEAALDRAVKFGLLLVDAIDSFLALAPGDDPASPRRVISRPAGR